VHSVYRYLLFLENDFKMDTTLTKPEIMVRNRVLRQVEARASGANLTCCVGYVQKQLLTAAGMLHNGAEVIRLMSRKYQVSLILSTDLVAVACRTKRTSYSTSYVPAVVLQSNASFAVCFGRAVGPSRRAITTA
jgi:hypothetical protein